MRKLLVLDTSGKSISSLGNYAEVKIVNSPGPKKVALESHKKKLFFSDPTTKSGVGGKGRATKEK